MKKRKEKEEISNVTVKEVIQRRRSGHRCRVRRRKEKES